MEKSMRRRKYSLILIDLLILVCVYTLMMLLQTAATNADLISQASKYGYNFLITAVCLLATRLIAGIYTNLWRYANAENYLLTVLADMVGGAASVAITYILDRYEAPFDCFIGIWAGITLVAMFCVATLSSRFCYQLVHRYRNVSRRETRRAPVAIAGAGQVGTLLAEELLCSPAAKYRPVCFMDVDREKIKSNICGIPVFPEDAKVFDRLRRLEVEEVFLALPQISGDRFKEIYEFYSNNGFGVKVYDFPIRETGEKETTGRRVLKEVEIEDLLFRDPLKLDETGVREFYGGKTVLVTGGGGSIGSELCRQIAAHQPKQLIIFDVYENNAYDIQQELKDRYPELNLTVLIGSVRDSRRMFKVFDTYRPQVVYHAAAHKHVPLMEDSPCEAIKNNVLGTYKTAYAAMVHGCERFVLISTDKAVNPTNVMGASKRLCEMIVQCFDAKIKAGKANEIPQLFTHEGCENADKDGTGSVFRKIKTEFVAVRFGNVLGSNGSVIPLFKKQIEKGGPITVTHPDVIRYFMTIPEAVSLVMLAGTYAKGGEIFVLDMGSPVKIDTLARNLIKQAGLKPDVDIQIRYTGLRPGEKLYEEKLMAAEGLKKTDNELIHIGEPIPFDHELLFRNLGTLMKAAYANDDHIRELLIGMVPTYHPASNGTDKPSITVFGTDAETNKDTLHAAG
jgi:FlaA1/EpsC-like NDP-sugar epimerase